MALGILSTLSVELLVHTIEHDDLNTLVKIPGVGKKTAERLMIELRDRFGIVQRLEFYSVEDLTHIVTRSASLMDVPITQEGSREVARRARGTPRIANRLLRRVRDYAQVKGTGEVTQEMAQRALDMLNVDKDGLDTLDRRYLSMLLERFDGGPAGVEALAAAMAEDSGTLEDVIEPYLIQQGYAMRTARGRIATNMAYLQFGMTPPEPKH